jgi:ubiquitin C-terminal hydrolase
MNGKRGLCNIGNTCFMNSALQCIGHNEDLRHILLNDNLKINNNKQGEITKEWIRLMKALWNEKTQVCRALRPLSFYKKFIIYVLRKGHSHFRGYSQNDVQEFIILLLDIFHESIKRKVDIRICGNPLNKKDEMAMEAAKSFKNYFEKDYSEIIYLFYGQIQSNIIDSKTGKIISISYEPICHFNLPIPYLDYLEDNDIENIDIHITDCFDVFCEEEELDEENLFEQNGKMISIEKKINIWEFPKILMVTFKRFDENLQKNNHFINFPLKNLDLSPYCLNYTNSSAKFNLFGVCNHSGGVRGGHYYAYCLGDDNKWREFNDNQVSEILVENVVSSHAYVLFYKKI